MGGFHSIKSVQDAKIVVADQDVEVEATATVGRRRDEQRQRRQHYILA